ncbi:MAG: hypothetical protein RMM58_11110 [Chloroflexota bacterium]|nr:hypothetical protein [Dehalococcoidia bacterium]MDW8254412.1 hypothetical protein [Chloroflexota bacterium]
MTAFRFRLSFDRVGSLLAVLAAIPAALPLLSASYLQVHDGFAHLFRLVVLDSAMKQGVFLPRWSPELVFGFGYPIFNFYNPLVSYAAQLFHLLGFTYADSLRLLVGIGVLAAGGLMYWYLRPWVGTWAALFGAAAYVYVPYHLLNIYVRGSFAEQLCYPLFPLALGLADRAFRDDGAVRLRPAVGLALVVAALLLAHNPSVLFFSGVLVASIAWRWRPRGLRSALAWAGGLAGVFAVALSLTAFFWLPFLAELPDTWIGTFRGGVEDFYRSLQPPDRLVQWALQYDYDIVWDSFIAVGTVQAALALLGALAVPFLRPGARQRAAFGVALALALALLMTPVSEPFWRSLPIASLMTFPWRLQGGMGLATAIAAAALPAAAGRWAPLPALGLGAAMVWASLSSLTPNPLALDDAMVSRASATRLDVSGALTGTTSPPQFVPRWVDGPVQKFAVPADAPTQAPAARLAAAEALSFDGWRYRLRLNIVEPGPLRLRTFYFPGWQATVDGAPVAVEPSGPAGEIALELPAGWHEVTIAFGETPPRRLGEIVSAASLILLLLAGALMLRSRGGRLAARGALAAVLALALLPRAPAAEALTRTDIAFGSSLRLLGWKADYADLDRRGVVRLDLLWLTAEPVGREIRTRLRLLDPAGQAVTVQDRLPVYGAAPSSRWLGATIVADSYDLPLPDRLPAGSYRLEVAVRPDGETEWLGAPAIVGDLTVPRSPRLPPPSSPATVTDYRFGGLAVLRGFDLAGARGGRIPTVTAGGSLRVTLHWTALAPIDRDYSTFLHLSDDAYRPVAQQDSFGGFDLRFTSIWEVGRPVRDQYDLVVPRSTPPGRYWLRAGLFDRDDHARLPATTADGRPLDSATPLTPILVTPASPLPAPSSPASGDWQGVGRLLGYDLPGASAAAAADCAALGAACEEAVVLHWEATGRPADDLAVFLHVRDASGRVVLQADGPPRLGRYPTSVWSPGDRLLDPRPLPGLRRLPAGRYQIVVGWYRPSDGGRLPVGEGDAVTIGDYVVR